MKTKIAILTFICMTLSITLFAQNRNYVAQQSELDSYPIGNDVYATFDSITGILTITGTGNMQDGEISLPINWNKVRSVIISEGITSVGNYAFYKRNGLNNLKNVSFPSTLLSIGINAFSGCNISSIYIPENVSYTANTAFYGCPLEEINVSGHNMTYSSEEGILFDKEKKTLFVYPCKKDRESYHIPNSVNRIYHSAFWSNEHITSISMGNNVRYIGNGAFGDCTHLTSLSLSDSLTFIGRRSVWGTSLGLDFNELEDNMWYIGKNLITITSMVPDDSDSIYVIKEGTRLIATDAASFNNVYRSKYLNIVKIIIPSTLEYINPDAFLAPTLHEVVWNAKHCHDFEVEDIYDNGTIAKDTMITYNPFGGPGYRQELRQIKKISFAKDVEYLPAGLCNVMPNLEEVYNYNPDPIVVSEDMFDGVSNSCVLFVPKGSKSKYEAASVWRTFYHIIEMENTEDLGNVSEKSSTQTKSLLNGQILILRGDKTYTVTGQEVK